MTLQQNTLAPNINAIDITKEIFDLSTFRGKKVLVAFFRFSTCPFCNLRIHELTKMVKHENFTVVAIFQSSPENLSKHLAYHNTPFPIISDAEEVFYRVYQLKKSYWGMLVGMFTRIPEVIKSLKLGGKLPIVIDGYMSQMPAEFLIDEQGLIHTAYYGKDEGDHIPLERIKNFFNLC